MFVRQWFSISVVNSTTAERHFRRFLISPPHRPKSDSPAQSSGLDPGKQSQPDAICKVQHFIISPMFSFQAPRCALRTSQVSRQLCRTQAQLRVRTFATEAAANNLVNIVEVGPRDGLQNEKGVIPVDVKVELINRLARAGAQNVEVGSFVSPKWVPQMGGTPEVICKMERLPGVHYAVLVPNQRGLDNLFALLSQSNASPPLSDEISIFTAATDAFTRANLNTTTAESLTRLEPVARAALDRGLRVRGYVSVVIACPYSGQVDYKRVRDVAKALADMGCYEVSLGDTVGQGTPEKVAEMIEEVKKSVPVENLAGHFHDTYGTAIANVFAALAQGIRTIDSSVGGLGGCPYSPGATGNVATEDVLYALKDSQYKVAGSQLGGGTIDLDKMVDIGWWISEQLGRESVSRAGRAIRSRRILEAQLAKSGETKAKL
ncbi:Hydroxymethylglutaryl-CoA lyase [Hypsizygus marmoreus]|uniref:hydroxymethylglutaryl-CoA lyase n=1 Tax=Hypsizygus marmoreus TaxID=39966 RepID=A0A369K906_HYPMA|nr:Hydroxymethylglutaryl-CoA lyase [Hypsizygus marmoreus]